MGWTRKILRVDLSKGTCKSEPLNMEWAQQYLGQPAPARGHLQLALLVGLLLDRDGLRLHRAHGGAG